MDHTGGSKKQDPPYVRRPGLVLQTRRFMKNIAILGSTGSIGQSALDVVRAHPDKLRVVGLAAGANADLLLQQALEFQPAVVAMASEDALGTVAQGYRAKQAGAGAEGLVAVAAHPDGSAITVDSPAKSGELVTIYGTGFGPTERARSFGFSSFGASPIVDTATVMVNEVAVAGASAFAVAGRIGVDAAQFEISDGVAGKLSVRVTVNGKDSNTVLIPVQ